MEPYHFELKFEVRDYECDLLGVVNNAVYQNYLEHARHAFIKTKGLDFANLYQKGYSLVLTKAELDYKYSLRSADQFVVRLRFGFQGKIRFVFEQDIFRLPDEQLVLSAKMTGTCINSQTGRPFFPEEVRVALQ